MTKTEAGQIDPGKAYDLGSSADRLSISKRTLARLGKAGKIKIIAVSDRRKAVPGSEILRILNGEPKAA